MNFHGYSLIQFTISPASFPFHPAITNSIKGFHLPLLLIKISFRELRSL